MIKREKIWEREKQERTTVRVRDGVYGGYSGFSKCITTVNKGHARRTVKKRTTKLNNYCLTQ